MSGTNCLSGEVELCLEAGRLSGSSRRRGGRVPGRQGRHELGGRAVRLGRAGRSLCGGPSPGGRGQGVTVDRVGRDGRKRRTWKTVKESSYKCYKYWGTCFRKRHSTLSFDKEFDVACKAWCKSMLINESSILFITFNIWYCLDWLQNICDKCERIFYMCSDSLGERGSEVKWGGEKYTHTNTHTYTYRCCGIRDAWDSVACLGEGRLGPVEEWGRTGVFLTGSSPVRSACSQPRLRPDAGACALRHACAFQRPGRPQAPTDPDPVKISEIS